MLGIAYFYTLYALILQLESLYLSSREDVCLGYLSDGHLLEWQVANAVEDAYHIIHTASLSERKAVAEILFGARDMSIAYRRVVAIDKVDVVYLIVFTLARHLLVVYGLEVGCLHGSRECITYLHNTVGKWRGSGYDLRMVLIAVASYRQRAIGSLYP